jgi:DNA (cytosine-5)-methyltransferase 1
MAIVYTEIPVIDLFAGPGGLGEGFSSMKSIDGKPVFDIKLSIEKDQFAHQTLELRAFYRQFIYGGVPLEYYEYLRGAITRKELFDKFEHEASRAKKEAWMATLGEEDRSLVKSRIEEALNGADNWVLIGGPPCQAYSLVGRSRMRNVNPWKYAKDKRHKLYKEYLQILADHQPPVFVMENVKGLLSSQRTKTKKENTFNLILADLKYPSSAIYGKSSLLSYKLFSVSHKSPANSEDIKPENFVVRSEEYGIPQARHRIIILGIRSDIYKSPPETLRKIDKQVPIEAAIGDLPKLRSGLSKENDSLEVWRKAIKEIEAAKWMKSIPSELRGAIQSALKHIGVGLERGSSFVPFIAGPTEYDYWYIDKNLGGACNHETRSHIREDLHRYFFATVFAQKYGKPPKLNDFPSELLPKHANVKKVSEDTVFNDRFRVQISGRPSTTVVSHISKDGHYYIHYDSSQCRSLTVREAARLQTFPDNYFFEGNRTQQYHQVGNAVPPLLAKQIAGIVYDILNDPK